MLNIYHDVEQMNKSITKRGYNVTKKESSKDLVKYFVTSTASLPSYMLAPLAQKSSRKDFKKIQQEETKHAKKRGKAAIETIITRKAALRCLLQWCQEGSQRSRIKDQTSKHWHK